MSTVSNEALSRESGQRDFVEVSARRFDLGAPLEFPIYLKLGDAFVLYRAAGDAVTDSHLSRLTECGLGRVWIPRDATEPYLAQLKFRADRVVEDVLATPAERAATCYEVGASLAESALREPKSIEAYRALESVVDRVVDLFHWHSYSLMELLEQMERRPDLYEHSMQVCMYGVLLGKAAGYDRLHELGLGLLFHDIGKLDLPVDLLEQPGALAAHEWNIVHRHPTLGIDRLKSCGWVHPVVRDVVQNHHERLDGTGYPRRCRGVQLTVASRIAAIVNAFDSRTTDRPYRPAVLPFDVLQSMITRGAGMYDRSLLEAFVRLLA